MKRSVWITVERSVLHFSAIYLNPLDHFLLFFHWHLSRRHFSNFSVGSRIEGLPLLDRLDTGTHDDMYYQYFISCKVRNKLFIVVSGLLPSG